MVGAGAALALFAALAFGLYTIVLEHGMVRAREGSDQSPALGAAFLSTLVAFTGFWAITSATGIPSADMTPTAVAPFVIAGIAYPGVFRMAFYEGIDRIGAGVAAAIVGAYPAVSAVLAIAFLGEILTGPAAAGIALIIGGVGVVQISQRTESTDAVSAKLSGSRSLDLLYPVAAMALFGASLVLIKYGLDRFPHPIAGTAITQTSAFVVLTGWLLTAGAPRDRLQIAKPAVTAYVVAGSFIVIAWLAQFFALQLGTVITVAALLNTYPLIVVAITYGLARQFPRSPRIILGVVAIVAGATLVQVT